MVDKQFTRIAKALADPRRFEILRVIAMEPGMSCGTISERFPVGQSTVSHHLKLLADAELVDVRREGQHGYFTAMPEVLEAYLYEMRQQLVSPDSDQSTT